METIDSLRPDNEVKVTIWGPEGNELYQTTNSGFHNLESAVNAAIDNANLSIDPKDCVFEIENKTKDVTHRYRINAHGHLKLII